MSEDVEVVINAKITYTEKIVKEYDDRTTKKFTIKLYDLDRGRIFEDSFQPSSFALEMYFHRDDTKSYEEWIRGKLARNVSTTALRDAYEAAKL